MDKYSFLFYYQFINQICSLITVVFLFIFLMRNEKKLYKSKIIIKIADYSWYIYLTQTLVIPLFIKTGFPISLLCIITVIISSSFCLKIVVEKFLCLIDIKNNRLDS